MEDVKASEVVGELKKAARLFEVFQQAHKMVAVVSSLEQMESQTKARLEVLQAEFDKKTKDMDDMLEQAGKSKEFMLGQVKKAQEDIKVHQETARQVVEAAQK